MTSPRESPPSGAEPNADPVAALEVALTKAAYSVKGVNGVFAPTTIAQVPQFVAALVAGETERFNRVLVTPRATGVEIDARIGVEGSASAAEAARGVADAILELAATGGEVAVSVQVSRISGPVQG